MPKTDSIVLITGASSGMGHVTARTLAESGYRVVAAMRAANGKNAERAEQLRALQTKTPVHVVELDVTQDASVNAGVQAALDMHGRIDVLVNCAGVMWTGITEAFTARQFQDILNTNLVGTFRVLKAVLPAMRRERRGLCITITSLAGRTMAPGMGIYSASKAGLEALAEIIGYEVASQNIDSVIIEPGFFQTNLLAAQREPEDKHVAEAYGPHFSPFQQVHENVAKAIMEAGVHHTDPQLVADLVRTLIETPAGRRPLRVTAGLDFGASALNEAAAPHQREFLRLLGFGTELRVGAET